MPSKSRRVAARQAQMTSKRKRKAQARPVQAPPRQAPVAHAGASDAAAAQPAQAQPAAAPTQATAAPRPKGGFRSRGQARAASEATPLTFSYIGPEMRRIGILTGIAVAILVVLTFILR